MVCRLAAISRVNSGAACDHFSRSAKKVAFTAWRSSDSRSEGVSAGLGPSSKVRAMEAGSPVWRMVGPKSCEEGATAPQEKTPPAAAAYSARRGAHRHGGGRICTCAFFRTGGNKRLRTVLTGNPQRLKPPKQASTTRKREPPTPIRARAPAALKAAALRDGELHFEGSLRLAKGAQVESPVAGTSLYRWLRSEAQSFGGVGHVVAIAFQFG